LRSDESLGDLLNTADGALMGLVTRRNGGAPARLVVIDPRSGATSDLQTLKLPARWRISTLAEGAGGTLYTTAVSRDGETSLVRIGRQGTGAAELVRLSSGGTIWNNGLQSLIYAPSGQLLAFGALRYETPNAVYSVDVSSGLMTRLAQFDASRLAVISA